MMWLKSSAAALVVVGIGLAVSQGRGPVENRLGDRALARIAGLSDTSAANTSACGSYTLTDGQVLFNNCPAGLAMRAGPDSPIPVPTVCVKCIGDQMTKLNNTSGGPGIQAVVSNSGNNLIILCQNKDRKTGDCANGTCENLMINGMCGQPPNNPNLPLLYENQN